MTLRSLHQHLTRRLLAVIVPLLVAVGGIVGGYAGRVEVAESDASAALAASRAKERILMTLQTVAEVPRVLATLVAEHPPGEQRLQQMLTRALRVNPDIYGMALAAEPGGLYPDRNEYCLYAFRQGVGIRFRRLDSPVYRYLRQPWYQRPRKLGRAVWSEPYFDAGGGEALMSTYSVPLVSLSGRFLGVATADVTLQALKDIVETVAVPLNGRVILLSAGGRLIAASTDGGAGEIRRLVAEAGKHPLGSAWVMGEEPAKRMGGWLGYIQEWLSVMAGHRVLLEPVGETGWTLAVLIPLKHLYAPVYQLILFLFLTGLGGTALALLVIRAVTQRATAEVSRLADLTGEIAKGQLEVPIPEQATTAETARLARSFCSMQAALRRHIRDLLEETARRERMEDELRIARDIQMQMLPQTFPTLGNKIEVCAAIEPAREVGGDFYDGFLVDEGRRFCFVVGDVVGKGVPAALFMAVTRTLIRSAAAMELAPGAVLAQVNRTLQEGNDHALFVTVFLGILNPTTGELAFANAGHPPPLLWGRKRWLTAGDPLPPVGAWPRIEYPTWTRKLEDGETIIVYTDGISEAMNQKGALFGMERMMRVVDDGVSPCEIAARMQAAVKRFTAGAPQTDDITLLTIRWSGR